MKPTQTGKQPIAVHTFYAVRALSSASRLSNKREGDSCDSNGTERRRCFLKAVQRGCSLTLTAKNMQIPRPCRSKKHVRRTPFLSRTRTSTISVTSTSFPRACAPFTSRGRGLHLHRKTGLPTPACIPLRRETKFISEHLPCGHFLHDIAGSIFSLSCACCFLRAHGCIFTMPSPS